MELNRYINTYYLADIDSIHILGESLSKMLEGKKYTWVECYQYAGWRPRIATHQEVKHFQQWETEDSTPLRAGFTVHDTYGMWSISTREYSTTPAYVILYENGFQYYFITQEGKKAWWAVILEEDDNE